MLKIYNSLTRKIEEFKPINPPRHGGQAHVGMYACGLTVYDYAHIGNLRRYVGDDILVRTLKANNYRVTYIMNVTDVGHLVSDADLGEDKLEKGAKERNMDVWELAKFFEEYFWHSLQLLNVEKPDIIPHATEHIKEQIELIKKLEKKGFTYVTDEAVYFNVKKFPKYTDFTGQKLDEKKVGIREETVVDPQKRNPQDFVLWFFTVGRFSNHVMRWQSPWGEGFPGWHIECSAMSMKYLGESFDLHSGGMDHLTIHHPNEIAQSEAATGQTFVKYWVHHGWLLVDGEKMAKSKKNFYTINDVQKKAIPDGRQGFDPLALRYFYLNAHYRDSQNFTWQSLEGAQKTLNNLRKEFISWGSPSKISESYWNKFMDAINNDLNTPQALAVVWEMVKSNLDASQKAATLLKMDNILGLNLNENQKSEIGSKKLEIPQEILEMVRERESLRKQKRFHLADQLRNKIKKLGYDIEDINGQSVIRKI